MSSFDVKNLFNADGLVAVVTGGGSGIGRVIARALATNGATRVYILGRRSSALEETASTHPAIIVPITTDVTEPSSLSEAATRISTEIGHIDFLVAGAGMVYFGPPQPSTPPPATTTRNNGTPTVGRALPRNASAAQVSSFLLSTTPTEFLTTYRVNTMGVFYTLAAFIPLLDAGNKNRSADRTQRSQAVAIASIAGQNRNATGGCAYGMSKAAVIQLMGQMNRVLAPLGIRGNTLSPGYFPSELAGGPPNYEITKEGTFPVELIPLQRAGTDEEMAGTILYLASKAGGYVNGHVLVVDGGNMGYR
ncbi:NAD(P)-binding protein [Aspergillus heterothallicus]